MTIKLKKARVQPQLLPETGAPITAPLLRPVGPDPAGQVFKEIGGQIKSFGLLAAQVQETTLDRDNKTKAGNAYLDFSDKVRNIENKYYSRKGLNAEGLFDEYRQDIDKAFNDSMNDIDNDRAQQIFDSMSRSKRISSAHTMQTYKRGELDRGHLETSKALIENSQQDAAENFNNPVEIQASRDKIITGVGQISDMLGLSEDQENIALENAISKMHVGVVEAMLLHDAASAKIWMEDFGVEIQGTDRTSLEAKVERYGVLQESLALADIIHAEANEKEWTLTRENEEIKERTKGKPEVRLATEERTKSIRADEDINELDAREKDNNTFYEVFTDSKVAHQNLLRVAHTIRNPKDRQVALDKIKKKQAYAFSIAKRQIEQENPVIVSEVIDKINNGTVRTPADLIRAAYGKVTSAGYSFLSKHLREISSFDVPKFNSFFNNIYVGGAKKNPVQYSGSIKAVKRLLDAGGKVSDEEYARTIINGSAAGEEISGSGFLNWYGNMTGATAEANGVFDFWLPFIPDHQEDSIIEAIENYNLANPNRPILPIDEFAKRLWLRTEIMGHPDPNPSVRRSFRGNK